VQGLSSAHTHHGHACCLQICSIVHPCYRLILQKFVLLTCPCWPLSLSIRHSAFSAAPTHIIVNYEATEPNPSPEPQSQICVPSNITTCPMSSVAPTAHIAWCPMFSFYNQIKLVTNPPSICEQRVGALETANGAWLLSKWPLVASGNDDDPICESGSLRNIMP